MLAPIEFVAALIEDAPGLNGGERAPTDLSDTRLECWRLLVDAAALTGDALGEGDRNLKVQIMTVDTGYHFEGFRTNIKILQNCV